MIRSNYRLNSPTRSNLIQMTTNTLVVENYCAFCDRHFRFKDLYDQHTLTCEFFFRRRSMREREFDAYEQLPSAQEQYKLIQHLSVQVAKLQKEVISLKGSVITRKKKVILEWLHSPSCPLPSIAFEDWIREIPVDTTDLEKVFEDDLTNGMLHCLKNVFSGNSAATAAASLPIRAFTQKPGTIYIWTKLPTTDIMDWRILDTDTFERWIKRLAHRFLQEFIKWQMINSERIQSTDEEKEKNIASMRKINGLSKIHEDRRRGELRRWLFGALAQDFAQMVEWDYV